MALPAGYIFLCNNETEPEVLQRRLFALPRPQFKNMYTSIPEDSPFRLFLFNTSSKRIIGPFKGVGKPALNIDREAFQRRFPAQLRFNAEDGRSERLDARRLPSKRPRDATESPGARVDTGRCPRR